MASMLETTASRRRVSPPAVTTPVTVAVLDVEGPHVRRRPQLGAEFGAASPAPSATARVPPIGYQTPSAACMWAMAHSTAGEP